MLLLIRGREEEENEEEEEEKEEEDEEEEESFLLSRKLRRVSMSKSILRSEGFTVAVLAGRRSQSMKNLKTGCEMFRYLRESMTAWTLVPGLFTTVSASFLISESFLMFFSSSSCT